MKRMIKYIRQWMALRKRKKAVKMLENELQDRMTRIDETMELKEVSDAYAKYVCMMNSWDSQIGDMLSAEANLLPLDTLRPESTRRLSTASQGCRCPARGLQNKETTFYSH